jgi:hypothetical protein
LQGLQGPTGATGATGPTGATGGGSVIGITVVNNVSSGTYFGPWGASAASTESDVQLPMPGGTASALRFSISPAPGAGKTATVTIRLNGASTPLTCTISDTNRTCSDLVDSVTFADGDTLSILFNKNPNFAVNSIGISLKYVMP